jgi:hypothetical protein
MTNPFVGYFQKIGALIGSVEHQFLTKGGFKKASSWAVFGEMKKKAGPNGPGFLEVG